MDDPSPTVHPRVTLSTLPTPLLDRVLALVDPPTRPNLLPVSRLLHKAARRALAHELTLSDDDSLLLDAQDPSAPHPAPPRPAPASPHEGSSVPAHRDSHPSPLKNVARSQDWADDCRSLQVVAPPPVVVVGGGNPGDPSPPNLLASTREEPDGDEPGDDRDKDDADDDDDDDADTDTVPIPPLDDTALFHLVSRLGSLTSFAWASYRLPPTALCLALGQACKNLASFSLDIVPSPFVPAAAAAGLASSPLASPELGAAPGSPLLGGGGGAGSGPGPGLGSPALAGNAHGYAHGPGHGHGASPRWDAPHLSSLPLSLTRLSLSHLSSPGARALGAALPSFPSLETLELARTLFVDDKLLEQVGAGARALRRLVVRDMGGTKLSEGGLGALFDGCEALEALELDCVEGRFSRTCWQKLAPLPPSLHTLRLTYSEQPPHKSWVLDHLSSLPSILGASSSSLHTLSLKRRPHPAALVPGSHHLARYPIEGVVEPRPLDSRALDALVERGEAGDGERRREWRVLEVDLFSVDVEALRRLLDGATGLRRLQILFDSPFRNLLTLAPSFAACSSLRECLVSVPPHHTPELAPLTPAEYLAAVPPLSGAAPGSPASAPGGPPLPSSPRSGGGGSGGKDREDRHHHPLRALDAVVPPTRDWRRFCKKAHSVERVSWVGRGGVGTWTFGAGTGRAGSGLTRVGFEPTRPLTVEGGFEDALGRTSRSSSIVGLGGGGGAAYTQQQQRRRSSTVSLAETCLSSLSLDATAISPSPSASSPPPPPALSDSPTLSPGSSSALLATPPPGASPPTLMSFAAAGRSVSPRKGAGEAALGLSLPGLGGFGTIGGGGGGGGGGGHRRRSSASASGAPHQHGSALGLALHGGDGGHTASRQPDHVSLGWASPLPPPVPVPVPVSKPSPAPPARPPPAASRTWAAAASGPRAGAGAGWAEPSTGGTTSGAGAGAGASAGAASGGGKGAKGEGEPTQQSPSQGRRGRGGQGRRRELTK
ncbi:hypothetical protein DMC30DRAFT_444842 [Rhodotorula diobovata]|uniref:Uncharacterized protein n=1 Tax=Rhodotorula diobovata TaxID=5288 RepID=A0A5C5G1B7_9BASI|nr:hypothetical protein DMC30DRAFT_444842 [Rhodotorula diobovata]